MRDEGTRTHSDEKYSGVLKTKELDIEKGNELKVRDRCRQTVYVLRKRFLLPAAILVSIIKANP